MGRIWPKLKKSLAQLAFNPFSGWFRVPENRISDTFFATTAYQWIFKDAICIPIIYTCEQNKNCLNGLKMNYLFGWCHVSRLLICNCMLNSLKKKNSNRNLTANFLWARHHLQLSCRVVSFQITTTPSRGWSGFFTSKSRFLQTKRQNIWFWHVETWRTVR